MSGLITDEMVEVASEALHDESCPRSLRGSVEDCCDWTPWARAALIAALALATIAGAWAYIDIHRDRPAWDDYRDALKERL